MNKFIHLFPRDSWALIQDFLRNQWHIEHYNTWLAKHKNKTRKRFMWRYCDYKNLILRSNGCLWDELLGKTESIAKCITPYKIYGDKIRIRRCHTTTFEEWYLYINRDLKAKGREADPV